MSGVSNIFPQISHLNFFGFGVYTDCSAIDIYIDNSVTVPDKVFNQNLR